MSNKYESVSFLILRMWLWLSSTIFPQTFQNKTHSFTAHSLPMWFVVNSDAYRTSRDTVPVEVISPSPVRHISLVAKEKMVTGLRPSTCLITGSWPTRPNSCTRLMAGMQRQTMWWRLLSPAQSLFYRFTYISPGWGWCPCSCISPAVWTSVEGWDTRQTQLYEDRPMEATMCISLQSQMKKIDRWATSITSFGVLIH